MTISIERSCAKWECRVQGENKKYWGFSGVGIVLCVYLQSSVCVLVLLLYRYINYRSHVREESIVIFKKIGIQLIQTRQNGSQEFHFIDSSDVQNIFINEGIQLSRVIFYLAFQEKNKTNLTLAFRRFQPNLSELKTMYSEIITFLSN